MTPEVIVHHPIPENLRTLLENLGYTAAQRAKSYTCFMWRQQRTGRPDAVRCDARGGDAKCMSSRESR